MIKTGKMQNMLVARRVPAGFYLVPEDEPEHQGILLPKKYATETMTAGDIVNVFIYRDSEDRHIATTLTPILQAGELGELRVVSLTSFGSFLSWGLEKDLFMPSTEQLYVPKPGESCMVYVNVDHKDKIYATMKFQKYLKKTSPYAVGDWIEGTVYKTVPGMGAFVAADGMYSCLIPQKELVRNLKAGDRIKARIVKLKEDGRLDLSLRDKSYLEIPGDAVKILEMIMSRGGYLDMNDKTSPDKIKAAFGMSKLSFKKAVGHLLKDGTVEFHGSGIRLCEKKKS